MKGLRLAKVRRLFVRAATLGLALSVGGLVLLVLLFPFLARSVAREASRGLNGSIQFRGAELGLGNAWLTDVRVVSDYDGEVLQASRVRIRLHPLRMLLQADTTALVGDVEVEHPVLTVKVDPAGNLNLRRLTRPRPKGPDRWGAYRGTMRFRDGLAVYRDERGGLFLYRAKFSGELVAGSADAVQVQLALQPEQRGAQAAPLAPPPEQRGAQGPSGSVRLGGRIGRSHPRLDLTAHLKQVELSPLSDLAELRSHLTFQDGQVNGGLWASGTAATWKELPDRLVTGGRVTVARCAMRVPSVPWAVADLEGALELVGESLNLNGVQGRLDGMPFQVSGQVFLRPSLWLDLLVSLPAFQAARLRELSERVPELEGTVRLELAVEGAARKPHVQGRVRSARLASGEQALEELDLTFQLNQGLLHVQNASAQTAGGRLWGDGWVVLREGAPLVLDVRGQGASL
ncbi:MAG: hypothetical protein AB1758_18740, partial [Candidatus Eremiobacterota bacterium]